MPHRPASQGESLLSSLEAASGAIGAESLRAPHLPSLSTEELRAFRARAAEAHAVRRRRNVKLDMTRGKPALEQLDLANPMLDLVRPDSVTLADGGDGRNYYGGPQGLPEARALFAAMMGAPPAQVAVGNNSSLALMHDAVVSALLTGTGGGAPPWGAGGGPVRFLCPVPGYDRHFAICELYGIEMIPVPLTGSGPDMDAVERLVADPSVKGMWCVPKYSNPTGETYSRETVERLAAMQTGAADFRLFWDNAYAVHHLTDTPDELENVLEACARHGNPDRALVFSSTSKVTFAGGGLGLFAASPANLRWYLERAGKRSIGPDKLNQLRHVRFLRDCAGIAAHMAAHRRLLAPKFAAVQDTLSAVLGRSGVARWTQPRGGYFVSLDVMDGCARRVVELAEQAGVAMVPAGGTFPYGRDPDDRNIRLAPSFPPVADVARAIDIVAHATLLAASEAILAARA